jgi:hypothetical protein
MTTLLIVEPLPFTATSTRGSGAENLAASDPKEVWADVATGSASLVIDLGSVRSIDTVFLGYVQSPAATATWAITGGSFGTAEQVVQSSTTLRVPDAAGTFADRSHALWTGAAIDVRYLAVTVNQPAGAPALSVGVFVAGLAATSEHGHEWGAGRRPIDTGSVTSLPSGGFAIVEGARKRALSWTFGDLSTAEVDSLEAIALSRGESAPVLVVEDATRSAGLWSRVHYGLMKWKAFDRRNRAQTAWDLEVEEWV